MTARADRYPVGASVTVAELSTHPHPLLCRLRQSEPVSWIPALDAWLVTSRSAAETVLRDARTFTVDDPRFSTAQVVGPSMLSLDGAAHARHRAPFARPFRPAVVDANFLAHTTTVTERLISAMRPGGQADLRPALAGPLAVSVVAKALGLRGVDDVEVLSWYAAIVTSVGSITAGGHPTGAGAEAFAALRRQVSETIREGDPNGLVRAAASGPEPLTAEEVVSNAAVMMFGGIDTTESMILNTVWLILRDSDLHRRLREQPGLLDAAVEEALRLEPAAMVVDRYATRPVRLGDADIVERDLVIVSIAGANRDPNYVTDPDVLDLDRPDLRGHLSFARGPHFCLGMDLARLETVTAVRAVLALPDVHLDPHQPAELEGLVFRKPPALPVRWSPDGLRTQPGPAADA